MTLDIRWLLIVVGNGVLFFLTGLLNDTLGSYSLYLYPCALAVYYPASTLLYGQGIITCLLSGILADVMLMLPSPTSTILFPVLFTALYTYRNHLKTYSVWHMGLMIHMANGILLILTSLMVNRGLFSEPVFYVVTGVNLLVSHVYLLGITPWFLSLQRTLYASQSVSSHEPNSTASPTSL